MRRFRRLVIPLALAAARLLHRRARAGLLALGIAAGAATLAVVLAGSLVAHDRSAARALAGVPEADRVVQIAYAGIPDRGIDGGSLEPTAQRALELLALEEPARVVQYKLLRLGGAFVNLAALDGVETWVRLRSGRMPRTCSPRRCEVVRLAGRGRVPNVPGIRLVPVGEGALVSPVPFGRLQGAQGARIGESFGLDENPPFVVAEGVSELGGLPALESIYRTYAWVSPLEPGSVHPWDTDAFAARVIRARSTLDAASIHFEVTAPLEELQAAASSGRVAGRRLLLVGGQAAALLLGFVLLAAAGLRRDVDAAWSRLTWRGARPWQLVALSTAETAAVALAGTAVGWAVGSAAAAALAHRAGSPPAAILTHSALSRTGLAAAVAVAATATLVVMLALRARAVPLGGRSVSTIDVAALGALAAVALALARGDADAGAVGSGGTGTLLLLLPGLVTFVVAVACARLLSPVLRLLERGARRAAVPVRLAALSLARSPGHAAVAVTFLVAAVGLALFAGLYRSTLAEGLEDQAAYAFPLDVIVREDLTPTGLVPPLEAAPLEEYEAAADRVVPVLRRSASVQADQVTLLGVPSGELAAIDGWRDDFAELPLDELRARIEPEEPPELRGAELPADAAALVLPARVRGGDVGLEATVLTPRGDFARIDLGQTRGGRDLVLRAELPGRARGGRVVALALRRALAVEGHAPDFARVDGVLSLGRLAVDGPGGRRAIVRDYADWHGLDNVDVTAAGRRASVRFLLAGEGGAPRLQPRQSTDAAPVPVVASPGLAAAVGEDGLLPVRVGSARLRARVVATARRFPTTSGEFVLGDERLLFVALNTERPGSAEPNELWLDSSSPSSLEARLARPPFDALEQRSRGALARELRADPLARASLAGLAAAAAVALLLALAGLVLLLVSDLRDERAELLDLEAQGADPRALRRHVRLRAGLVAGLGLVGGLGAGAILAALVVDVVTVTATAVAAEPPLVLAVDARLVALAVAASAALAALAVGAVTRGAFRSP